MFLVTANVSANHRTSPAYTGKTNSYYEPSSSLVLGIMGAWMLRCYPRLLVVFKHAQIQWHLMCICKLDAHNLLEILFCATQLFADLLFDRNTRDYTHYTCPPGIRCGGHECKKPPGTSCRVFRTVRVYLSRKL